MKETLGVEYNHANPVGSVPIQALVHLSHIVIFPLFNTVHLHRIHALYRPLPPNHHLCRVITTWQTTFLIHPEVDRCRPLHISAVISPPARRRAWRSGHEVGIPEPQVISSPIDCEMAPRPPPSCAPARCRSIRVVRRDREQEYYTEQTEGGHRRRPAKRGAATMGTKRTWRVFGYKLCRLVFRVCCHANQWEIGTFVHQSGTNRKVAGRSASVWLKRWVVGIHGNTH